MADPQIQQLIGKITELVNEMKIKRSGTTSNTKVSSEESSSMSEAKSLADSLLKIKKYSKDITEEELNAHKKTYEVLKKEVEAISEETEEKKEQKQVAKDNLEIARKNLELLKAQSKATEKRLIDEKVINKLQGVLTNSLTQKLGLDIRSEKVNKSITKTLKEGGSGVKALGAGMSSFAKESLSSLNTINMFIKGMGFLHTQFKQIDDDSRNIARSLNLTYDQASAVRDSLTSAALSTKAFHKDLTASYATGKAFAKSMVEMNSQLGTSANFEKERLSTYTQLRDVAKFEAEVLEDINKMSLASKQTQLDITKNRLAQINLSKIQLGRQVDERKVMQDIAKASYNIKINYLGRDKDLAKAATQARALGMELSQTERIAENFMNFEESIQKQMEAELLTGRTLNLERARYFALTNDLVGLQTELNRQGVTAEKFGKMNRIQQNAIAGAMGMSKDEMSKMLVEQKALQNLGVGSLEAAQEKYELAVKNGTVDKFAKELGEKSLLRQFQQQSLQERMTMAIERMLTVFEKLAVVFRPLYKMFVGFLEILGKSEIVLKSIAAIITVIAAKRLYNVGAGLLGGLRTPGVGGMGSGMSGGIPGAVPASAAGMSRTAASVIQPSMAGATTITPGGAAVTAPASAAGATGGGFFSNMGSKIKSAASSGINGLKGLNPMKALQNAFKGFSAGKWLGKAAKIGGVSLLFEALFANSDIQGMISSGASKSELNKMVGARVAQMLGSAVGAGVVGGLLSPIPGGTFIGGMLGSYAGTALANLAVKNYGAEGLGGAVLDTFYKKDMKEANVPGLATGGVVEKTGLIKAHAGEVYTGGGTLKMFEGMWQEMKNQNQQLKEQNKYLAAIANKSTVLQLDRQVLATEMGKEVAMSYGNILNPGSQTFS